MASFKNLEIAIYKLYLDGATLEEIHAQYPRLAIRDIDYIISVMENEETL